MSLMDKLKKNSKIKNVATLADSQVFSNIDVVSTEVPMINVALTGTLDGGIVPGLTVLAGPSKHFKTSFALLMASAYLKTKPDSVLMFYDSEFGSPQAYFDVFGIDANRVLHTPIKDIEELKFDLMNQLQNLTEKDDVIFIIDSVGNLASKKEVDDALDGKNVADMTRAKALKSLFRIATPHLTLKKMPMLAINHTYKEIGMFPKDVVSGGTGIYYSANTIWIIGRRQNKTGTEVTGYDFIINMEKSRYVKEKSKIPISVSWDGGIEQYSGLLDVALAGSFVVKPSNGWYAAVNTSTGEEGPKKRLKELDNDFWQPILDNPEFQQFVKQQYQIGLQSEVELDLEVVDEAV